MKNRNKKLLISTILIFALVFRISIPAYAKHSDPSISFQEVTGYTLFELFGFVITPQTIMIILIILLLFIVSWLYSSKKHYKDYYDFYKRLYDESNSKNNDLERRYFEEQQRVKELKAWRAEAEKVYPDIEHQIAELHAVEEGVAFSEKYKIIIPCEYLEAMIRDYNNLSDAAKEYAGFDLDTALRNLDVLKTK